MTLSIPKPTRDFLTPVPQTQGTVETGPDPISYLRDIAQYLRELNADILTTTVVSGASQISNAITDGNVHRVEFQIGGHPVKISSLLVYSTWTNQVAISPVPMSKYNDGIPFNVGNVFNFAAMPTHYIYLVAPTATVANPLYLNGPADATLGGFFLYGYSAGIESR